MAKAINLLLAAALLAAALFAAVNLGRLGGAPDGPARGLCAERLCGVVFF
jgi:hypothetical protein